MLNVQAMTQTMSAMSLPQLQQYASLHKDDPYTVALALSIANQKKQAMTAQQGQAGMQPMPKVVDQALAQMLPQAPQQMQPPQMPPPQMPPQQAAPRPAPMPEDVGIGQLPAPNIAKMAGGGIVAFGDGGEVPRYNGMGGSFVGPAMTFQQFLASQGITPSEFANAMPNQQQTLREAFKSTGMGAPSGAAPAAPAAPATPAAAAATPASPGFLNSLGKYAGALKGGLGGLNVLGAASQLFYTSPEEMATLKKADAARLGKATGETLKGIGIPEGSSSAPMSSADVDALTSYTPTTSQETKPEGPAAAAPTQQDKLAELKAQYASITGGPKPAAGAGAGISGLNTKPMTADEAKAAAGQLYTAAPLMGKLDELRDQIDADITKRRAALLAEQKAMPEYGVEAEGRINAQRKELEDDKRAAGWMSVLEAGLATMAGTSPFAFANIGAGGQKGLASYKDALKDFKKLQLEYDKAQADIERARYAAKREDFKTRQEFEDRAAARMDNVRKIGIDVTGKVLEVNANVGAKVWETGFAQAQQNLRTMYQEQGATARANAGLQQQAGLELLKLSQPGQTQQLYESLADPNSKAAKGLGVFSNAMYGDRAAAGLLKQYQTPLGEAQLKQMEAGTPQQRLEAMQIRQRLKELQGVPAAVNVANPLP